MRDVLAKYEHLLKYLYGVVFSLFAAVVIVKMGTAGAGLLIAAPLVLLYFYFMFKYPKLGLYSVLILSFFIGAMGRYLPVNLPFGLGVDILLVVTYVVIIFKYWKGLDMTPSYNDIVLLNVIWMGYVVLEIFNPLAQSFAAWFYSMRGVALYQVLAFGLSFTLLNSRKDFMRFMNIWLWLSLLGAVWAIKQKFIGLDPFEQAWLDAGAEETHVLFGKLRHFSYYFDAGTFGASMGHACIVAGILFLGPYSKNRKIFFLVVALLCFYGLLISGTRGALAVPGIGGILFLILTKNVRLLTLGGAVLLSGFIFLKFTTIGQSNYDIARLRSALSADDPSLQVRIGARKALSKYLADKPFGTGLGTAGFWGQRFSPNTWMANFETDGLYTRIRAETGRVGHTIYVYMFIYILIRGFLVVWNMKDEHRKYYGMAIMSGFAGILVANYGNSVMTQFPESFLTYFSVSFVFSMQYWNKDGEYELPEEKKKSLLK